VANQALHVIKNLYKSKRNLAIGLEANSTRKIMLVGHSVGGMVARATPLLSNHPACSVREIVQLSTPNIRPPYCPDASLDATYALINRYWTQIYRNASMLPELCAHLPSYSNSSNTQSDSALVSSQGVSLVCPTCIASMRLISITGGDVELEVPAALTDLNSLFPAPAVPKIVSVARTTSTNDGLVYGLIKTVFNYSVKKAFSLAGYGASNTTVVNNTTVSADIPVVSSVSDESSKVAVEETGTVVEVGVEADATTTIVGDGASVESSVPAASSPVDSPVSEEPEEVKVVEVAEVAPAASIPPLPLVLAPSVQFVSVRSSQLKHVAFPIDHAAVVWCFDLLHSVTNGMRVLSKANNSVYVDWSEVFPTVYSNTLSADVSDRSNSSVGTLVHHINERRAAARQWLDATNTEYKYIATLLPQRYFTELPFAFVSNHLIKIVVCYLIVSLLILFAPLLRTLSGNAGAEMSTNYDNILPWNHFSVDIVYAGVFSALRSSLPPQFMTSVFTVVYQLAFIALVLKAVYDYFFGTFSLAMYTNVVHWVVAYMLALLVRGVLLLLLQSVQNSSYGVYNVMRSVLRYTVWNQTIRRAVRGMVKSVHSTLSTKLPFYSTCVTTLRNSFALLAVSAVWAAVYVTSMHRAHVMNRVTFGTSVLVVASYVILVLGLAVSLLLPTTTNKKASIDHTIYNTDLLLLYLPAPVLAFPTFHSSFRVLYSSTSVYSSVANLYSVLDMSRLCYVFALGAVAVHVWVARSPSTLPSEVKPLRFLFELLGPHTLQAYVDLFGSTFTSSGSKSSSASGFDMSQLNTGVNSGANGCVHEDGGKNAIFEQITVDEQGQEVQTVAPNVTLGSTYKVISCNCARDTSLTEIAEWCSWCKCRKCGGKHLPAASKARFNAHFTGINAVDLLDFSMDLVPLLVLFSSVLLAGWYVGDSPYLYLYTLGAVAVGFVVREWSVVQK